jgi:hypothetical protein
MKLKSLLLSLASVACLAVPHAQAQSTAEAADKAFTMAARYSAMGYYITPSKEGFAGFATTLEFTLPVNAGLDYVFILAGDKYALDTDVWIESEFGNTIVKDTRKVDNGLCGVRWRSDYNGTATVVVHFARVTSRCGWAAVVGRRSTATNATPADGVTPPTKPAKEDAPTK